MTVTYVDSVVMQCVNRKHLLEIVNVIQTAAGRDKRSARGGMEGSIRNIISDLDNSGNKYKESDNGDNDKYSESTLTAASKTTGKVSQTILQVLNYL